MISDKSLDEFVAEKVCGYTRATHKCGMEGWRKPSSDSDGPLHQIPAFSRNLNMCAMAEKRIAASGMAKAYSLALKDVIDTGGEEAWSRHLLFATATARQRCDAMKKAVELSGNPG